MDINRFVENFGSFDLATESGDNMGIVFKVIACFFNFIFAVLYYVIKKKKNYSSQEFYIWFYSGISFFGLYSAINLIQIFILGADTLRATEFCRKITHIILALYIISLNICYGSENLLDRDV